MTYSLAIPLDGSTPTLTVSGETTVDVSAALALIDVATVRDLIPAGIGAPRPAPLLPSRPVPTHTPAGLVDAAPTCVHGPRTYRTGTSTRGPWAAWFCPTPKGTPGQCEPAWVDQVPVTPESAPF